jgi:radical SAM protein with 4Fe4S-binding SPASM domain
MKKLYLDITNKCNLHCKHCLNSSNPQKTTQLSLETIKQIIKQIKPLKIKKIKLGGGEPLIHSQLQEILELLHKNNYSISMTTNGLRINNKMINFFKKYEISLSISLETSKKTHEYLRGQNTYSKTLNNTKLLAKNNVDFWIESMMLNNNLGEFKNHIELVKTLNSKLKIRRIKNIGRATKNMVICAPSHDYKEFINLINNTNCKINIEKLHRIKNRALIEIHEDTCRAGIDSFHINYDGEINPCIFLGQDFVSGNVHKDPLLKTINAGQGFKKIKALNSSNTTGCPAIRKTCDTNLIDPLI